MGSEAGNLETIGPYRVQEPPRKGGMGDVYRALDPAGDRVVAVKVLSSRAFRSEKRIQSFERDVEILASLDHPNIVRVLDHGRDGDLVYFAMEHVAGSSLADLLRRRRLTLREVLGVFKGICRGLEAAHEKSISHRSLSPRHILVSDDLSVVKLADFGISRAEESSSEGATLETSELSVGALYYLAPERAKKQQEGDPRSDVYSAGVVLYEMLTGRVPVGRFSLPSQLNPEIPAEVDPLVLKCLASEPQRRFSGAGSLLRAVKGLEDALRLGLVDELRGISRSTTKILLGSTSPFRQRWLWMGLAAVLVIAAVLLGTALLSRGPAAERGAAPAADAPKISVPARPSERPDGPGEAGTGGGDPAAASADEPPEPPAEAAPDTEASAPASTRPPAAAPRAPAVAAPRADVEVAARRNLEVARDKATAGLSAQALADLRDLLATGPGSSLEVDAYLLMAQIHEREGRLGEAMGALVEIGSRHPQDPRAADARFSVARLTLARGESRELEALTLFSEVAARHPDSARAPEALAEMAAIERKRRIRERDPVLGATVPAELVTWRRLAHRYPDHRTAETALWELGRLYEELERHDLAAAAYAELGTRFPSTRHDAWWEAGQIYERKLRDREQARDAYLKVPDSSAHHGDAQRRLRKLD